MASVTIPFLTLHDRFMMYDRERAGGGDVAAIDRHGGLLAYTDLAGEAGVLWMRNAGRSRELLLTVEVGAPAGGLDAQVAYEGRMEIVTGSLIAQDGVLNELVGEQVVAPGVHQIQVRVAGREEAEAATEAWVEAYLALPNTPSKIEEIPRGPEHWWVTFLD